MLFTNAFTLNNFPVLASSFSELCSLSTAWWIFVSIIMCVISWVIYLKCLPFMVRLLPDMPNSRSLHSQLIPRGGGAVFALLMLLLLLSHIFDYWQWPFSLYISLIPLILVGLLDDKYNMSSLSRFSVQLLTGAIVVSQSTLYSLANQLDAAFLPYLIFLFLVFLFASIVNFVNFMDGMDGLVSGCFIFYLLAASFTTCDSRGLMLLVGSLTGFFFWNWCPAKVFMGDVGSTFLGAVFAGSYLILIFT